MKGKLENITIDYKDNKPVVSFKLNNKSELESIEQLKDIELDITIKKHKEKRSLTANATAWVLMQQLADKVDLTVLEVYKEYIKDLNIYKQMTLPKDEFKTLSYAWQKLGIGWVVEQIDITDKDEVMANFYYGSSTYNVNQMYKFIKNIIEDCKLQGIPIPEDKKIERMCENWK